MLIRSPPMYTALDSPDVFRTKERAQQGVCEEAPIGSWASSKACTFMLPFAQVTDQTGRFFLHEHPWTARSWFMLEVSQLSNIRHVRLVQGRICQFAMRSECNGSVGPVLKPTGFLIDSFCVAHQKHHQKHHGERQVCSWFRSDAVAVVGSGVAAACGAWSCGRALDGLQPWRKLDVFASAFARREMQNM